MMIVSTQDIKGLPPNFHQNADLVVMSFSTQKRQLQMLEENYAFLFKHDEKLGMDFLDLIKNYTVDHGFIVVDSKILAFLSLQKKRMFFVFFLKSTICFSN